jgi:tetratricopeptide (TPR) repeat protein
MVRSAADGCPRFLLALCIMLWAGAAVAGDWRRLAADGFTVVGDVSEQRLQKVAVELARFRATVGKFMSTGAPERELPVRVFAVSRKTWNGYLQLRQGVAGYFHPDHFGVDIVIDAEGEFERSRMIIYHEYTHYYMHANDTFPYPLWFEEGVAQMMSTLRASGKKLYAANLPHGGWLDTGSGWMSLAEVVSATYDSPQYVGHKAADQFYMEALLLTHYLIIGAPPARNSQLNRFLERLVVGKLDPEAASQAAFGVPLATIEQEVLQYYRKGNFLAMIQPDPVSAGERYPVVRVTDAQGWDEVGHVMLRVDLDPALAMQTFQKVLEIDPGNRRAMAGIAVALERQDRQPEADQWLARMRATTEPAGLPDRYCGEIYASRLDTVTDMEAEEDLRRRSTECFTAARRADPNDLQSLIGLACLAGSDPEATSQILEPLVAALQRHPENEVLALGAAQCLWNAGRHRESLDYLKRAIERTRDVEMRRVLTDTYRTLGSATEER